MGNNNNNIWEAREARQKGSCDKYAQKGGEGKRDTFASKNAKKVFFCFEIGRGNVVSQKPFFDGRFLREGPCYARAVFCGEGIFPLSFLWDGVCC